jgi:dynein heavy chain, axonemal
MLASPYIKPFESRAKDWEKFLLITQDVIDLWLKVQSQAIITQSIFLSMPGLMFDFGCVLLQWLYLEPIFASDDIKKQMPEEARRFASVDGVFKNTVAKCIADPKVLTFTRSEGLLENLKSSFDLLELINKGLNAYLEQKRCNFFAMRACAAPRFIRFAFIQVVLLSIFLLEQ